MLKKKSFFCWFTIPIVVLLLLCSTLFVSIGGCLKKDDGSFCTDLFYCMYNEDKTGVIILELTGKGQEQEILVIPEEINGLPVVQLGGETSAIIYTKQHRLRSESLKKIYVCTKSYTTSYEDLPNLSEVVIINENTFRSLAIRSGMSTLNNCSDRITIITEKEILQKYQDQISIDNGREYRIADVTYYVNRDGVLTVCWLDDSLSNEKYIPFSLNSIYTDINYTKNWNGIYEIPDNGLKLFIKEER